MLSGLSWAASLALSARCSLAWSSRGRVVDILRFSAAQRQEICAIYKIYSRVMVRVLQERQAINTLMSQALVPESMPSTFGQAQVCAELGSGSCCCCCRRRCRRLCCWSYI